MQKKCQVRVCPGVVVDGFTPPGGGGVAIPRLVKKVEETFCEVIIIDNPGGLKI